MIVFSSSRSAGIERAAAPKSLSTSSSSNARSLGTAERSGVGGAARAQRLRGRGALDSSAARRRENNHSSRRAQPAACPDQRHRPGTGMGVALITEFDARHWHVIETEGGHVSFAPQGSEERDLHEWLMARHGRVSAERVLSGNGLARIHAALGGRPPSKRETPTSSLLTPADIVRLALAGDDVLARRSLARFCAILGSFAGDCALIHGARTVAIAGGMALRFASFLRASAFVERFLDKGRFAAWLERVRVALVAHPEPGLLGAALALKDQE